MHIPHFEITINYQWKANEALTERKGYRLKWWDVMQEEKKETYRTGSKYSQSCFYAPYGQMFEDTWL